MDLEDLRYKVISKDDLLTALSRIKVRLNSERHKLIQGVASGTPVGKLLKVVDSYNKLQYYRGYIEGRLREREI